MSGVDLSEEEDLPVVPSFDSLLATVQQANSSRGVHIDKEIDGSGGAGDGVLIEELYVDEVTLTFYYYNPCIRFGYFID